MVFSHADVRVTCQTVSRPHMGHQITVCYSASARAVEHGLLCPRVERGCFAVIICKWRLLMSRFWYPQFRIALFNILS